MAHRLDPLLRPRSVAVVGASEDNDAMGEWSLKNLLKGGYEGDIYPVNPKYDEVQGVKCYSYLADLPAPPDLVMFAVSDRWLEKVLDDAIDVGAKAAVIMSTMYLDDDETPPLRERVARKIRDTGHFHVQKFGQGEYDGGKDQHIKMAHKMAEAGIDQNVVFSFFQYDFNPSRNGLISN